MRTNAECGMRNAEWRQERGQSTLEYILVLAAILVAVVAASSKIKEAAQKTITDSQGVITSAAGKL